jgi:HlyD family secretion protein
VGGDALDVSTEKPLARNIIESVSANGKIQPEVEVKISSDVSGEIVELFVKEGDRVKKGDLLCKIKPDIYESALERVNSSVNSSKANLQNTKAQLEQAKANLANAEAAYNRSKKLFDQNAISQQEFDNAKAQYESAKAGVAASEEVVKSAEYNINGAQASLKEANENLSKTLIYAPVDATVSKLNVEKGERVQGVQGFQGTEIMRLANLNEMEVSVEVNENDIIRVNKNDTSIIEVDAYKDKKFKGIVTEIANSANTVGISADQVTNFAVKIRILQESYRNLITDKNPAPFRPGMSATVEIQTRREANVMSVPIQAVTTRVDSSKIANKGKDDNKKDDELEVKNENEEKIKQKEYIDPEVKQVVFVAREGKAVMVEVKIGIQDDDFIQIVEGLKPDDEVVIAPYGAISKKLKDGKAINVVDKDQLFKTDK